MRNYIFASNMAIPPKPPVNALIFDLGGVILNIDYLKTENAFKKLGFSTFGQSYSQLQQNPLFDRFETGKISEKVFFEELAKLGNLNCSHSEMIKAWNAMLLDLPRHRLELLKQLKGNFQVFLLSNTNDTHLEAFFKIWKQAGGRESMEDCFHKTYFSNREGLRKPDPEIFLQIITSHNLKPEAALFIDDTLIHIRAAEKLGIQVFHNQPGNSWENNLSGLFQN
jgi:glucose-1-phosphatase